MAKKNNNKKVCTRIDPDIWDNFRRAAMRNCLSIKDAFYIAITEYIRINNK